MIQRVNLSKDFYEDEFICQCGCGLLNVKPKFISLLQAIRNETKTAMEITSGCRCEEHNMSVGGKMGSAHTKGLAADIAVYNSTQRFAFIQSAIKLGVIRIGIATDFIHIDIDFDKPQEVLWLY